jgi:hypothetical protein
MSLRKFAEEESISSAATHEIIQEKNIPVYKTFKFNTPLKLYFDRKT